MCLGLCLCVCNSQLAVRVKSYADQQQKANYVWVGLFCASDLLNRGRFCICEQEGDSQVEFPAACTALCPSHLYLSCVSDGIWRDQKGDVILLMRGAAGAFSQLPGGSKGTS